VVEIPPKWIGRGQGRLGNYSKCCGGEETRASFSPAGVAESRNGAATPVPFHFQQAAEKALRAYLLAAVKSVAALRTHVAVGDLVATAAAADPDFESLRPAKRLDQYHLSTRYPNELPGGIPSRFYDDPDEAAEASRLASTVLELVGRKLGL